MGIQGSKRLNALVHFLTIFQQSAIGRSDFTGTVRAGSFSANDQCIFNLNDFSQSMGKPAGRVAFL